MEEKEKFEANKKSNAPFLRAISVLMKEKNMNQAQVAKLLSTKSGTFSDYKNGKKRASQEMYDRLARAFGGRLNIHYLTGESEYMMLSNVPDEEIIEYSLRERNPDYDVMKQQQQSSSPSILTLQPTAFENSVFLEKAFSAATAYQDKLITTLEKQVTDKNAQIEDLRRDVIQRDKMIAERDSRIQELEAIAKLYYEQNPSEWPFPMGVADTNDMIPANV